MANSALSKTLIWVLIAVALLALVAACGSDDDDAAAAPTDAPAEPAATPAMEEPAMVKPKVDRVVMGIGAPPSETLEISEMSSVNWPIRPPYEYLLGIDPTGEEGTPQLATSWSLEPDGKSYRFQLREGVKFHNDFGEFTAKDVVSAVEHMVREESTHRQRLFFVDLIEAVEVVNDYEVVIRNAKPDSNFLTALGQPEAGIEVFSSADLESRGGEWPKGADGQSMAGTGPYKLREWRTSEAIIFERVPFDHWRVNPDFPEFEYRLMNEASTRLAALITGEIQLADLQADLRAQAVADHGMVGLQSSAPGQNTFGIMLGPYVNKELFGEENLPPASQIYVHPDTPLLDVKVRAAINHAIDRNALNESFIGGEGLPMYNTYMHPTRPGWNPDWVSRFPEAYGFNPQRSRELLAEAGYGPDNPLKHTVQSRTYPYFPAGGDMQDALFGFYRDVGIDVNLETLDGATRGARSRVLGFENDSYIYVTSVRQYLGFAVFNSASNIGARAGLELVEPSNIFDNEVRVTVEPNALNAAWLKLGNYAYDNYMSMPLFWIPSFATADPNIVSGWQYPGSITGTYTHPEYIAATPQ